jgi:uncharacterized protein involved in exopolysaccharide biosynthesis
VETIETQEINLKELIGVLWKGRWLVVAVSLAFAAVAAVVAFTVPKRYTATVVVAPVNSTAGGAALGGLSGLASQFGGLASLAGITVGAGSTKDEYIAVLQSEELTRKYIQDNNLLPVLFAKAWDPVKKGWKITDPKKMPTLWKANLYFKGKIRSVTDDKKTGMVLMTVTWTDPEVAARWANGLVKLTNDYVRDKKIREAENNIAYLKDEANKTDMVQVRSAIYNVLESEIKTVMMAKGSEEYALRTIDRAVVAEKPSSPKPGLWIAAGFVFGGVVAVAFLLLRNAWIAPIKP